MTSGCTVRMPYFTVASNSVDRLMRLRAGSTAQKPDVALRQIMRGGLCGAGWTQSNARRGCASASGSRARGLGAGYSAGRSACPWPRDSPRCVLHCHPAVHASQLSGSASRSGVVCCWPARSPGTSSLVAAVSPTFGRLFEGTDEPSLGQTWPAPTDPLNGPPNMPGRRGLPLRAWPQPQRTTNPKNYKEPHWNAAERLAAGWKTVNFGQCRFRGWNGGRQRSEDGGSTSCLDDLHRGCLQHGDREPSPEGCGAVTIVLVHICA
jgi:hypothetical protein